MTDDVIPLDPEARRREVKPRLAPIPFNQILLGTTAVYLVKDLIPREGLVVVWGPPKGGKTFWTFDLIMHVALGWCSGSPTPDACGSSASTRSACPRSRRRW